MEVPKPKTTDSITARVTGEYFKIAQDYIDAGVCVFCELEATGQFPIATSKDGRAKLLLNKFPRSQYDMLAITTDHAVTIDQLTEKQLWALHEMKLLGRSILQDVIGRNKLFFLNRDGGDQTVMHYHDQIQSYWSGLITWSLEEGRADNLDQKAHMLIEAAERLKYGK